MTYQGPTNFIPNNILYNLHDTLDLLETHETFLRYKVRNSNCVYKIVFGKYNNEIKHFIINNNDTFKISFVLAVNIINSPLTEYMYKYLTDQYDTQFHDDLYSNIRIELDNIQNSDIYREMIIINN